MSQNIGVAGEPANIMNPGISDAALHCENIKLTAFYLCLMAIVSRVCVFAEITLVLTSKRLVTIRKRLKPTGI